MRGRTYIGRRSVDPAFVEVTVDGEPLDPRRDIFNHSPSGFEWGYGGSGPSQLALAILAHHYAVTLAQPEGEAVRSALRDYQRFKESVVAAMPRTQWALTSEEVQLALHALWARREQKAQ